jgi:hypothetical protein
MSFSDDANEISIAEASEKQANLARDESFKNYWESLVDEWLKSRAKSPEKHDRAK